MFGFKRHRSGLQKRGGGIMLKGFYIFGGIAHGQRPIAVQGRHKIGVIHRGILAGKTAHCRDFLRPNCRDIEQIIGTRRRTHFIQKHRALPQPAHGFQHRHARGTVVRVRFPQRRRVNHIRPMRLYCIHDALHQCFAIGNATVGDIPAFQRNSLHT